MNIVKEIRYGWNVANIQKCGSKYIINVNKNPILGLYPTEKIALEKLQEIVNDFFGFEVKI